MKYFKFILLFLFVSFIGFAQNKDVCVVLLSGQSNMAGHGNYDALDKSVKSRIKKVSKRVFFKYYGRRISTTFVLHF